MAPSEREAHDRALREHVVLAAGDPGGHGIGNLLQLRPGQTQCSCVTLTPAAVLLDGHSASSCSIAQSGDANLLF
jgi:hypothetical protein